MQSCSQSERCRTKTIRVKNISDIHSCGQRNGLVPKWYPVSFLTIEMLQPVCCCHVNTIVLSNKSNKQKTPCFFFYFVVSVFMFSDCQTFTLIIKHIMSTLGYWGSRMRYRSSRILNPASEEMATCRLSGRSLSSMSN